MTQTLISERAQISNVLNNTTVHILVRPYWKVRKLGIADPQYSLLEFNTPATTRSYLITICRKIRKLGIADYHHLCILIQVLVRFLLGSYRREYRPLQNKCVYEALRKIKYKD